MHRLLLLILATTACVADSGDEGFVVLNNATPGAECAISASADTFVPRGTIYLGAPQPYTLTPLIESRIIADVGQESQRTVALRGARVTLSIEAVTVTNGNDVKRVDFSEAEIDALEKDGTLKFSSLFSAPLSPNGGLTTAQFDIVSISALAAVRSKTAGMPGNVRAQFVATSVLYGDLGGDEVQGLPYTYPVTACTDCVVNVVSQTCPAAMGTIVRPGNGCNPFQDGVVDCCVSPNGVICPAPIAQ